jgi:hypothetical protein
LDSRLSRPTLSTRRLSNCELQGALCNEHSTSTPAVHEVGQAVVYIATNAYLVPGSEPRMSHEGFLFVQWR